jgi:hypothetical protein
MANDEVKTFKGAQTIRVATMEEFEYEQTRGPSVEVPEDVAQAAREWLDNYGSFLAERATEYWKRKEVQEANKRRGVTVELGAPIVGPYVGWDVLMISPIELTASPNQQPNRIVAAGALTRLLSVMWTNPAIDVQHGFAVPANIQLGNRTARVSFDQLNVTTATAGPNFTGVFNLGPAPVPPIIFIWVDFIAPAVTSPEVIEVNVTADIVDLGQPYASFASYHIDVDAEPPWFSGFPPDQPPLRLHFDVPMRYMVYPE